jgi:hypothetical protein
MVILVPVDDGIEFARSHQRTEHDEEGLVTHGRQRAGAGHGNDAHDTAARA